MSYLLLCRASRWFSAKESACSAGDTKDMSLISGSERALGGGHGNLKNPMDRGAWRATVYGVTKSQTWLSMHMHFCVTNYHKLIIATYSTYLLSHSLCGSGVQSWVSWVLCFRNSHMVCGPGLQSPLETCLGKDLPPSSCDVGRIQFLKGSWTLGLSSLLVVGQRLSSVPCMAQSRKQHPFTFAVFWGLKRGAAPVGQRLRLHAASASVPYLIPGQGTRSHMPQLKSLHAATERSLVPQRRTRHSQINRAVLKEASPRSSWCSRGGAYTRTCICEDLWIMGASSESVITRSKREWSGLEF